MKKRISRFWYIFKTLFAGYRTRLSGLAVLGLMSGFLDGVSVSLLVPLFTVFLKGGEVGSNFAVSAISSALSFIRIPFSFQTLLVFTLIAFLLKTLVLFVSGYMRGRTIAQYKLALRRRLYEAFLGTSFSYLRAQKTGHLNHIVMFEAKQSARLFDDCIGLVLSVGSSLMYLAVAFALSWQITVLTILLGTGLIIGVLPLMRKIRRDTRALITLGKGISHGLAETLIGIKTVKALGVEREVASASRPIFQAVERAEFRKYFVKLVTKLSFEPVSVLFILCVFAVSYLYLPFDLVSFIAIVYMVSRIFGNINNMQSGIVVVLESLSSAEEVVGALRDIRAHTAPSGGNLPFAFSRELAADELSFSYDGAREALTGVSFRVRRGEIVGIVGPSGAGKTTLVDLLLGLLTPTSGRIMLDGVDARTISAGAWRRRVIYVPQEAFLRNDTLAENIRFYDSSITDADILAACEKAHIGELVGSLQKGLRTVVGERGTRFSGGERQRIALARALARKPAVLVLDEATSALDAESERSIKDTLASLRGEVTVLIIAHRLTTVLDADKIIALENGKVVEEGSPAELQKNPDSYLSRALRAASAS